jgi:hypothetical protein
MWISLNLDKISKIILHFFLGGFYLIFQKLCPIKKAPEIVLLEYLLSKPAGQSFSGEDASVLKRLRDDFGRVMID